MRYVRLICLLCGVSVLMIAPAAVAASEVCDVFFQPGAISFVAVDHGAFGRLFSSDSPLAPGMYRLHMHTAGVCGGVVETIVSDFEVSSGEVELMVSSISVPAYGESFYLVDMRHMLGSYVISLEDFVPFEDASIIFVPIDVSSGSAPSLSGIQLDASGVLQEVLDLLPVCIPVLVVILATKKGLSWALGRIREA